MVLVFTQYDRLVRTKRAELEENHSDWDVTKIRNESRRGASAEFKKALYALECSMRPLGIPMPPYARVSGMNNSSHGRTTRY